MRKVKNIIALVICVAIVASVACMPAFAVEVEDPSVYAKYQGWCYCSFGDSIPAGYDKYTHSDVIGYANVPGSYPDLVANAIGAYHCPYSCIGFRTNELLLSLNEEIEFDYYTTANFSWMYDGNGYCNYWDTYIAYYTSLSQLISINIGNNDVFTAPLTFAAIDVLDAGVEYVENEAKIAEAIENGALPESLASILSLMNELGYYDDYIPALISEMYQGFESFKANFPRIIEKLRTANDFADIAVVGMYNPYKNMTFSDNGMLKIGKIGDILVQAMNYYLQSNAEQYGYIYVDVTDTETFADVNGISLLGGLGEDAHPTAAGHDYMAQQILNALAEAQKPEKALPFRDVSEDAWYYDSVKYVYQNGLMVGVTDTLFVPGAAATRAQVAAILYRMAGSPDVSALTEPFIDVSDSNWAHDAITWAYNEGVVYGVTDRTFLPEMAITRAQLVTMLYRYADGSIEGVNADYTQFKDAAKIAPAYQDAVTWAVANGIVVGYDDGCFYPGYAATRAQIAAIITRFCQTQQSGV